VRRYGRSLHADQLQRNRGALSHLLQSGAKYMGLTHYYHLPDSRVVKLLPISLSFYLLSVAVQTLQLWSDWSSPGAERVVWQVDVREAIRADLRCVGLSACARSIFVVDASLLAMDPGSEQATLLILSVCGPTSAGASVAAPSLQLWLHTFEVLISSQNNRSPVTVTRRLMVTDKVARTPTPLESAVEDALTGTLDVSFVWSSTVKPSIHSCAHKVLITWSAHSVAGAPSDHPLHCVYVLQYDALHRPPLASTHACEDGIDTRIPSRDVLDIKVVRGMDGLCAVLRGKVLSSVWH